jgi:hypothetical protein
MSFSGVIRSSLTRRIAGIVLAIAWLVVLSGCWVESIHALYDDDFMSKDSDLVFDQRLNGSWTLTDQKCITVLVISAKDDVYDLQATAHGEGCDDQGKKSKKIRQHARLVKLDDYYFLDISPLPHDVCEECLAKHTIYQLRFDKDSFSMVPIDSDWLKDAVEKKTVSLSTMPDDTDMLTASSADLKSFCRKYAADPAVFKPDSAAVFKRKTASTAGS